MVDHQFFRIITKNLSTSDSAAFIFGISLGKISLGDLAPAMLELIFEFAGWHFNKLGLDGGLGFSKEYLECTLNINT